MNDEDLKCCFALMLTIGKTEVDPKLIWEMAEELVEARNKEESIGLPPIKSRKAKTK